jgi:hypothetical protein
LSIYSQSGRNSKKYFPFDVHQLLGLLYSENDVSGISTEKAFNQNVEKHHFSAYSTRLPTPEEKIEKKLLFTNSDNFPDSHQISKLSDISSRIHVSLKKADGLVFNPITTKRSILISGVVYAIIGFR